MLKVYFEPAFTFDPIEHNLKLSHEVGCCDKLEECSDECLIRFQLIAAGLRHFFHTLMN